MAFLLLWVETKDVEKNSKQLFEYVEKAHPGLVRVSVPPQPIRPQGIVFQFDGIAPDVVPNFSDLARKWAGENGLKILESSGPYATASSTLGTHTKVQKANFILIHR